MSTFVNAALLMCKYFNCNKLDLIVKISERCDTQFLFNYLAPADQSYLCHQRDAIEHSRQAVDNKLQMQTCSFSSLSIDESNLIEFNFFTLLRVHGIKNTHDLLFCSLRIDVILIKSIERSAICCCEIRMWLINFMRFRWRSWNFTLGFFLSRRLYAGKKAIKTENQLAIGINFSILRLNWRCQQTSSISIPYQPFHTIYSQ